MTMNLQIMSDLHLEFISDRWLEFIESLDTRDVDVLVLPGDLCTPPMLEFAIPAICARYPEVVYVAGNHEYYRSSPEAVNDLLTLLAELFPNFHWLQNGTKEIGGHRFAGTTLWFRPDPDNFAYEYAMNDFQLIKRFKPWVYEENERALAFLEEAAPQADVVVTHHLPSRKSIAPELKGDPYNRFYLCDVDDLIRRAGPPLWVHGHTHVSIDAHVGDTRVICNPMGYVPYHPNPNFNEKFVVRLAESARGQCHDEHGCGSNLPILSPRGRSR
jgi:Icc-related predicted phosphoesterase